MAAGYQIVGERGGGWPPRAAGDAGHARAIAAPKTKRPRRFLSEAVVPAGLPIRLGLRTLSVNGIGTVSDIRTDPRGLSQREAENLERARWDCFVVSRCPVMSRSPRDRCPRDTSSKRELSRLPLDCRGEASLCGGHGPGPVARRRRREHRVRGPTRRRVRRIDEAADVLAVTLLGMARAKHRAERRGEPWPPPEPPRSSGLIEKSKGPPRRVFRELEARDELVSNVLLEMTWRRSLGSSPRAGSGRGWCSSTGALSSASRCLTSTATRGAARRRGPVDVPAAEARQRARRVHRAARVRGGGRPHLRGQRDAVVRRGGRLRAPQAHDTARGRASSPGHHRRAPQTPSSSS